jgi:hypothetical protein
MDFIIAIKRTKVGGDILKKLRENPFTAGYSTYPFLPCISYTNHCKWILTWHEDLRYDNTHHRYLFLSDEKSELSPLVNRILHH